MLQQYLQLDNDGVGLGVSVMGCTATQTRRTRSKQDVWVSNSNGCSEIFPPELNVALPVHELVLLSLSTTTSQTVQLTCTVYTTADRKYGV